MKKIIAAAWLAAGTLIHPADAAQVNVARDSIELRITDQGRPGLDDGDGMVLEYTYPDGFHVSVGASRKGGAYHIGAHAAVLCSLPVRVSSRPRHCDFSSHSASGDKMAFDGLR